MSLIPWVDAAYTPTLAEAQEAYNEGYRACGFYLPGVPGTDPLNVWTPAQVQILRQAGLFPVPIVVPTPNLAEDPRAAATAAWAQRAAFNLGMKVSVLYDGPHVVSTGLISGPVWLPIVGSPPSAIGSGSAVQWGGGSISNWSVDFNLAALNFDFNDAIVVDMEHNVLSYHSPSEIVAWYQAFQSRISQFAAVPIVGPPLPAAPNAQEMFMRVIRDGINTTPSGHTSWVANENFQRMWILAPEDVPHWLRLCGQTAPEALSAGAIKQLAPVGDVGPVPQD